MNTFLEVLGIGFSLLSAGFLAWGTLSLSPRRILGSILNQGSHTRYAKELVSSNIDNKIGFIFLLLSIVLQTHRIMTPLTWDDLDVNYPAGIIAFVFLIIIFLISICVRNRKIRVVGRKVKQELSNIAVSWDENEFKTSD